MSTTSELPEFTELDINPAPSTAPSADSATTTPTTSSTTSSTTTTDQIHNPPSYWSLPPTANASQLQPGAGGHLTEPPMSLTVPPTVPFPFVITMETIKAHFTAIKDTALYYDLKFPYLCAFVSNCSASPNIDQRIVAEFLDDTCMRNEFSWNKYDTMVKQLQRDCDSNYLVLYKRFETKVIGTFKAANYEHPMHRKLPRGFGETTGALLDRIETEVKRYRRPRMLQNIVDLVEKVYWEAPTELKYKRRYDSTGFIKFQSTETDVLARFQEYKVLLVTKLTSKEGKGWS